MSYIVDIAVLFLLLLFVKVVVKYLSHGNSTHDTITLWAGTAMAFIVYVWYF